MGKVIIGIYKIENTINHKVYIGQSRNIFHRWARHKGGERSPHLKAAFEFYGLLVFTFEILEEVPPCPDLDERLNALEKFYAEKHQSHNPDKGYNLMECGRGHGHTEETKRRISEAKKGTPSWNKGKKSSPETIEKNKQAHLGKKYSEESNKKKGAAWRGRKHTEDSIQKMSKVQKEKWENIPITEEIRQHMREMSAKVKRGPLSEEIKRKISEARLGWKPSEETRRHMSEAQKGRQSPNKGKPMPEEQKQKIRATLLARNKGEKINE